MDRFRAIANASFVAEIGANGAAAVDNGAAAVDAVAAAVADIAGATSCPAFYRSLFVESTASEVMPATFAMNAA